MAHKWRKYTSLYLIHFEQPFLIFIFSLKIPPNTFTGISSRLLFEFAIRPFHLFKVVLVISVAICLAQFKVTFFLSPAAPHHFIGFPSSRQIGQCSVYFLLTPASRVVKYPNKICHFEGAQLNDLSPMHEVFETNSFQPWINNTQIDTNPKRVYDNLGK
jgi:hypothetical protein